MEGKKERKKKKKSESLLMKGRNDCAETQHKPSAFFKILINDFKKVLLIPPKYASTIEGLINQTFFLRDLNGQSWRVRLSMVNGCLAFQEGWDDFVLDHCIMPGELVVFHYLDHSMFEVRIFGKSAWERVIFDEQTKIADTSGTKRKITGFPHENTRRSKRQKTSVDLGNKCKVGSIGSSKKVVKGETRTHSLLRKAAGRASRAIKEKKKAPKKHRRASGQLAKSGVQAMPSASNYTGVLSHAVDEDTRHEPRVIEPVPLLTIPCNRLPYLPKSHPSEQQCYTNDTWGLVELCQPNQRYLLTVDGVLHIVDENLMDGIGTSMLTPNEKLPEEKKNSAHHKGEGAIPRKPPLRHVNSSAAFCGEPIIDLTKVEVKSHRSTAKKISRRPQGEGISPLLTVTQDNAPVVTSRASGRPEVSLIPKHSEDPPIIKRYSHCPGRLSEASTEKVKEKITPLMKGKTVKVKSEGMDEKNYVPRASAALRFSLCFTADQSSLIALPRDLRSRFGKLSNSRKVITLRDPSRRLWPVLYHEDCAFIGFICGWQHFARANKLKKGDVCEFEAAQGSEFTLQLRRISRS